MIAFRYVRDTTNIVRRYGLLSGRNQGFVAGRAISSNTATSPPKFTKLDNKQPTTSTEMLMRRIKKLDFADVCKVARYLEKAPRRTSSATLSCIEKYLVERGPSFADRVNIDEIITSVKTKRGPKVPKVDKGDGQARPAETHTDIGNATSSLPADKRNVIKETKKAPKKVSTPSMDSTDIDGDDAKSARKSPGRKKKVAVSIGGASAAAGAAVTSSLGKDAAPLGSSACIRLFASTLQQMQRGKRPQAPASSPSPSPSPSPSSPGPPAKQQATALRVEQAEQLLAAFQAQDALSDVTLGYVLRHALALQQALPNVPRLPQAPASSAASSAAAAAGEAQQRVAYNVVAGLRGDFAQLLRVFSEEAGGFPSASNRYVFLGDVLPPMAQDEPAEGKGRGSRLPQLQCLLSLLALQLAMPAAVCVLRGPAESHFLARHRDRHSDRDTSAGSSASMAAKSLEHSSSSGSGSGSSSGKMSASHKLQLLTRVLSQLPVGAVLDQGVFLAAGGVGPRASRLAVSQIDAVPRGAPQADDDAHVLRELAESEACTSVGSTRTGKQWPPQSQLAKDFFALNPSLKLLVFGTADGKPEAAGKPDKKKKVIRVGSCGGTSGSISIARVEDASKGLVTIIQLPSTQR
eukprot:gene35824-43451_t